MALIIRKRELVERYFESTRVDQSTLKKMEPGLRAYMKSKEEDMSKKQSLKIGSAVDSILLGEEGEYEDNFIVSDTDKLPSANIQSVVKGIFNDLLVLGDNPKSFANLDDPKYEKKIEEWSAKIGYGLSWTKPVLINKVVDGGYEFFDSLKNSFGRTVISYDDRDVINDVVNSLRTNPRTASYFDRDKMMSDDYKNTNVYFQYIAEFEYDGVLCKAMLDRVSFKNTKDGRLLIYPVDLKTMSGYTVDFPTSMRTFRYDIQAAFYTEALRYNFPDATVMPFRFVVESTTDVGYPLVFQVDADTLAIGKYGENRGYQNDLIGFDTLIQNYKYYVESEWKQDARIKNNMIVGVNIRKGIFEL